MSWMRDGETRSHWYCNLKVLIVAVAAAAVVHRWLLVDLNMSSQGSHLHGMERGFDSSLGNRESRSLKPDMLSC
jgi:hypothetical protein